MKVEFPQFVFVRRRDIELETGLVLAGQLVVDMPKGTKARGRPVRTVERIIDALLQATRSGSMSDAAAIFGWRNGRKPPNAADMDDDAVMAAWAETRLSIAIRIDPRNDGSVRVDSDMMRQMGLMPNTRGRA